LALTLVKDELLKTGNSTKSFIKIYKEMRVLLLSLLSRKKSWKVPTKIQNDILETSFFHCKSQINFIIKSNIQLSSEAKIILMVNIC